MALYRAKNVPTIEAYPTSTGGYVIMEEGSSGKIAVPYMKEDFERNYEPVPLEKAG